MSSDYKLLSRDTTPPRDFSAHRKKGPQFNARVILLKLTLENIFVLLSRGLYAPPVV